MPEPPLSSHGFPSHGLRRGLPSNNTTTKAREFAPIAGTGAIDAAQPSTGHCNKLAVEDATKKSTGGEGSDSESCRTKARHQ